jgi:undecaprenyl diphosphate synthase
LRFISSIIASIKTPSINELKKSNIPKHVAIIMDGNGRWAQKRKLPRIFGHKSGVDALKNIVMLCKDLGIQYLTAYSFSSENWLRPKEEVDGLMKLIVEVLNSELDSLNKNGVKINLIGQREIIPQETLETFENAEEKTKDNRNLVLNIAFSYGSRQEILSAAKKLCQYYKNNNIELNKIDETTFSNFLYTKGLPDPDLLIRTSGENRISNFLLWQIAYSELYFTGTLWPDFKKKNFLRAIYDYQRRSRRFGKL